MLARFLIGVSDKLYEKPCENIFTACRNGFISGAIDGFLDYSIVFLPVLLVLSLIGKHKKSN